MKTGWVYKITINNTIRYIGVSNSPKTRFKQHLREFHKKDKYLYRMIRESGLDESYMCFEIISEEMTILDAKRLEAKLILDDYFGNKTLWQSAPFSFKYF
jgi:predicted GIY-YIG superfamily endonuclease